MISIINEMLEGRFKQKKIINIEVLVLDEGSQNKTIKGVDVRIDPPHVQGDEKHAHITKGKFQISYGVSGKRKHPNKFPSTITNKDKEVIGKALGISPELFEWYWADKDVDAKLVLEELHINKDKDIVDKIDEFLHKKN